MLDSIEIDKKTKKIFFDFLEESKKFFSLKLEQKKKYKYTGLTRLDGSAGLGYVDRDIENGAFKESFAFNHRNEEIPFNDEYKDIIKIIQEIGFEYIKNINYDFFKMHDEQPLVRIHKYNKLKEDDYFYTNDDITEDHILDKLRFFPHRDYGTITLIYQFNDVKGLQVKTWNSEKWTDLSFDSNEIIVMNGVLMEDFGYEPTYHRLMNNDILKERYSMSAHFDLKQKYLGNLTIKERLGIKNIVINN